VADTPKLKYKAVANLDRAEIVAALDNGTPHERAEAIWSATYHDSDWRWVQTVCLERLQSPDLPVKWAGANCLGLLAVFHKQLDLHLVLPALHKASEDPTITSAIDNSFMEIRHHLKLQ
jgi:hypothetical protein